MNLQAVNGSAVAFKRTGESRRPDYDHKTFRRKTPRSIDREVIAWDMEGISLSGVDKPQHPVLFGCSKYVSEVLEGERLTTQQMCEYLISVAERNPHAIHVGFAFKYDANMIVYGLGERHIIKLWRSGHVSFRFDDEFVWSIRWIPGKMFTLSRRRGNRRNTRAKTSLTIYDYSSFFGGQAFLPTAEQILRDTLSESDRHVIEHGKKARGHQTWDDLAEIKHYWSREILLIARVFERFRDVMYRAGFALKEWYGPGALANYINAHHKLRTKMAAAQTTSGVMPDEVHQASKRAFSGGRFELFQCGRIQGPIYAVDINSAYPYALTKIPSLDPSEGEWMHVSNPSSIVRFGVYRIEFRATNANPIEYRPMPLFWRDNRGLISYPQIAHGWYWSPEAALAMRVPGATVIEGWEWQSNESEFPWQFLHEMYQTRKRIQKTDPLLSLPFKLGPNSLYGKYAQTVGWDKKLKLPPKSHALPVAGWVTSYCRSMLYSAISRDPGSIIAVETDSIYTTTPPEQLGIRTGDGLGEWGYEVYDEMIYMQSGMYHYKQDGQWKGVRSRGMNRGEFPVERAIDYVKGLGTEWTPITLETKPRFIGAGAAIASSEPLKQIMTSWRAQTKQLTLGDTGKRIHVPKACAHCRDGISPYDAPHRLAIHTRSDGEILSFPRALPWETRHPREVEEIRRKHIQEGEHITR